jgi:sugar/nucleoside kinase (ribokinase family)
VDFINTDPLDQGTERRILELIQSIFESFDMILISDQAETAKGGVVTAAVRALLADLAPAYPDKLFLADSRTRIHLFRNVCIKPNRQEADRACEDAGLPDYGSLLAHTAAPWMMVTHGSEGALLVDDGGSRWVRTRAVEHPVDICGAGDSFCAGMALAFAATGSAARAAEFGNRVAGITILKKGTGMASAEEVLGS